MARRTTHLMGVARPVARVGCMRLWLGCSALVPVALVMAVPAFGQSAPAAAVAPDKASKIESIVVTAERRSVSVQKAPLAITAVSGATLDKSFVNLVSDLNAVVPSLELTKASGFENLVTIRGVGSETPENSLTTSPGVSEFIDGVYIANSISFDQTLFDVDHIEVLRGPQGALYGTSSDGGAISIVTKQPELGVYGGQADVSVGNYTLFRERAEVNIPIGDTLAIRISGQKYDHDGFATPTIAPFNKLDDAHDQGVKAAVLWKPIPDFTATLTGMWYGADQNGAEQKNVLDPATNPRDFTQDYPAEFNLHTKLYHLNLQYDLDWFSIKSISGYQSINHQQQEDSSRGAVSYVGDYDDVAGWNTKIKNFNEEFDLVSKPGTPVDWVLGALAINQSSHQFVAEFGTPQPGYPCQLPSAACLAIAPDIESHPPSNLSYGNDSSVTRHSYAVFAQASYHITPDLTATIGGRYNYDSYSQRSINFSGLEGVDINTQHVDANDHVPTYKGDLDYNISPDALVYASISRGYKPGGTNGIDNSEYGNLKVPIQNTFLPETNTAFEIGSKNFFMDHALRVNLAAYYYFYKNMQFIGDNPEEFNAGMTNIPSVHAYGVEAETNYVAIDGRLHLNSSIALENSAIQGNYYAIDSTSLFSIINIPYSACSYGGDFYNQACWKAVLANERNLKGKTSPAMPKISGAVDISYTFDVPYGTLTPRAQFVFRGSEWERVFNEPTVDRINSYGQINLNLVYVPTGTKWTVSLAATNVTNVNGINSKYTDPYGSFQTSVEYIAPLQVIGTVAYKW